jgi:hypothetical protein
MVGAPTDAEVKRAKEEEENEKEKEEEEKEKEEEENEKEEEDEEEDSEFDQMLEQPLSKSEKQQILLNNARFGREKAAQEKAPRGGMKPPNSIPVVFW